MKREQVYSHALVVRLLQSYLDFRSFLEGQSQHLGDNPPISTPPNRKGKEVPFGQGRNELTPWPFMALSHAKAPNDGKTRARKITEIHVMVVDLEQGLVKLAERDPMQGWLLLTFYLRGDMGIEELCAKTGAPSQRAMQARIDRAVDHLVQVLESPSLYK